MPEHDYDPIAVHVVDETTEITIVELCEACAVEATLIEAMVEEGIIEPVGKKGADSYFTYGTITRTRVVTRLQRDLGVNLAGAGLALQLLDRIDRLRAEMRFLK